MIAGLKWLLNRRGTWYFNSPFMKRIEICNQKMENILSTFWKNLDYWNTYIIKRANLSFHFLFTEVR